MPPKIIQHPQNVEGKLYERARLFCRATGSPTPHIAWYKNNNLFNNNNNDQSELVFDELALESRGFYHCGARSVIDGVNVSANSTQAVLFIEGIYVYNQE